MPRSKKTAPARKPSRGGRKRSSRAGNATTAVKPSLATSSSATSTAGASGSESRKSGRGKAGRPTLKSQALIDHICAEIADGKSLRAICGGEGMPAASNVLRWLTEDEAFREQYTRAREAQADKLADEIVDMADAAIGKSSEEVQARRLAVDARKWVASKLKPKKYGDKVDVEHSGGVVHRIQKIERVIVDPANSDG